jgi:hypothetical protein
MAFSNQQENWSPPASDFESAQPAQTGTQSAQTGWTPPQSDFDAATAMQNQAKEANPAAGDNQIEVFNPFGNNFRFGIKTRFKQYPVENLNTYLAGAGKSFTDFPKGIYQKVLGAGHSLGIVPQSIVDRNQREIDESHALDQPLMATKSGILGNITGQAAPLFIAPGASGLIGGSLYGAGLGGLAPTPTGESSLENAIIGGASGLAGGALAHGVGRLIAPFGTSVSKARQALADKLHAAYQAAGGEGQFPLSVAQRTGFKQPLHIERASAMTSDDPAQFAANQAQAFHRTVLHTIGEDSPNSEGVFAATPDVLERAKNRITGVMDDVANRTSFPIDSPLYSLYDNMAKIEARAPRQAMDESIRPVMANINALIDGAAKNNGIVDGKLFQEVSTDLRELARKGNYHAGDLHDVLTEAMSAHAAPEDVKALNLARQQYRKLNQIAPAVDSMGNISPAKLHNSMMNKSNRNQALFGKGDQSLMETARAGKNLLVDTLGNSGTAERVAPLTVLGAVASGEGVLKSLGKAALAKGGLDAFGQAMRNQGIMGNYLANGIPGLGKLAPYLGKVKGGYGNLGAATGYGIETGLGNSDEINRKKYLGVNLPSVSSFSDVNQQANGGRIMRASGGRTDNHERLVNRLIEMAAQAKKVTDKTTEPLLNAPDEHIVKALAVANKAI